MVNRTVQFKFFSFFVDFQIIAAGYAAGAHASGYYCRVAGHAAPGGQDAFRRVHAFNIFRRGLQPHENDPFAFGRRIFGIFRRKVHFARRTARRGRQRMPDHLSFFQRFGVKGGMQKLVQGFRFDAQQCFFRRDHAFFHQVAGNIDGRFRRTLAVTGLQEKQFAFLNGKFHILHVAVVAFQFVGQVDKFAVAARHIFFQLADRLRCPYAGHHVFALGVDQVLAVNSLGAGCRVPGKGHAGSGGLAHIAEYHGLNINRRAPVAGDVVHAAVYVGPGVIPGPEYGLHCFHQLDVRILGEILADGFFIQCFEAFDQFFHIVDIQVDIKLNAFLLFDLVNNFFKF